MQVGASLWKGGGWAGISQAFPLPALIDVVDHIKGEELFLFLFFLQLVVCSLCSYCFISMCVNHTPQLILCQTLSSRLDKALQMGLELTGKNLGVCLTKVGRLTAAPPPPLLLALFQSPIPFNTVGRAWLA